MGPGLKLDLVDRAQYLSARATSESFLPAGPGRGNRGCAGSGSDLHLSETAGARPSAASLMGQPASIDRGKGIDPGTRDARVGRPDFWDRRTGPSTPSFA